MELDNLIKLIHTVSESSLTEFRYEAAGTKLRMSKGDGGYAAAGEAPPSPNEQSEFSKTGKNLHTGDVPPSRSEMNELSEAGENPAAGESLSPAEIITSPLVGTFYTAPSETSEPFVTVGDTVKKGQTLAIIEAMKLMNEIESEYSGTITEVLVKNGQPVEYGQPLFRITT